MKLGALELNARITKNAPVKKLTVYQYLWCDANGVEESGLGPRSITVEGTCKTAADRDDVEEACEAAGAKKLYFPSALGQSDDRYYWVNTHPAQMTPRTASVYEYTIECVAADPRVYDAATNSPVWS